MKSKTRKVLIGNASYGLWYGEIIDDAKTTKEIVACKAAVVRNCRHVRYWYGPTGGITSLAAQGPDPAKQNKIGAPCTALITQIVNVFDVSSEAAARFDAVKA